MVNNLQYIYLGISLFSSFCSITEVYIIPCSIIIGTMCLIDFYFVKKKDILLHHSFALAMIYYINTHEYNTNITTLTAIILRTEISTIFLILNNLLKNNNLKKINKIVFVLTFFYYRIYNYLYYLILNKNVHTNILVYSRNNFEYYESYIGLYGLFSINVYWSYLIIKKIFKLDKM